MRCKREKRRDEVVQRLVGHLDVNKGKKGTKNEINMI